MRDSQLRISQNKGDTLKPKLLITFLIIVILPIAILAWFGIRITSNERTIVKQQIDDLLLSKLVDYEHNITQLLEERERDFFKTISSLNYKPNYLRNIIRKESRIKQIFIADERGRLLYPSLEIFPNATEKDFLEKTDKIWKDKNFLISKQPAIQAFSTNNAMPQINAQVQQTSNMFNQNYIQSETQDEQKKGWFVWYWENGINLIYWRTLDDGKIAGIEIDKTMFIADIIGKLPNTSRKSRTSKISYSNSPSRIALFDSKDDIIYQWGNYNQEKIEKPKTELNLSYPLSSWKLKYFASSNDLDSAFTKSTMFSIILPLICVTIVFAICAIYFYRESKRQINEASTKVNFVNRVSHELKTPLTNIRMYAELLENNLSEEEERSLNYLQIINNESQRLSRLITNVLTFSRKQNNKLKLQKRLANIDNLTGDLIEQFKIPLEEKGIKIEFNSNVNKELKFDPDAIEQILINLFSNVEKYAVSGHFMSVETKELNDKIVITVKDKGPGIPKKLKEKIFDQFYRLDNKLTEGVSGTGIGLSIARELAQLHGGDIKIIDSEIGCCFEVMILCEV